MALIMTNKLRFKLSEPVRARITEPVFAFDREVMPSGTEVTGKIIGFDRPSRWTRAFSLMSGNFTPLRQPRIEFDRVLLKDGADLAIDTDVTPGTENVVRFTDKQAPPKTRVQTAKELARQQIEARKRAVIDAIKGPGKMDKLKEKLWSMLPYHPESMPAGTRFTATLKKPLDFGTAQLQPSEWNPASSLSLAGDVVNAVLMTALDSQTAQHEMAVEASLSRPVFSADNHLIFPEGSRLVGTVVQARPARHWHRSGKLAFMFTRIDAPASSEAAAPSTQQVEGRLESVGVSDAAGNVRLDEEGGATVADSKKRFIHRQSRRCWLCAARKAKMWNRTTIAMMPHSKLEKFQAPPAITSVPVCWPVELVWDWSASRWGACLNPSRAFWGFTERDGWHTRTSSAGDRK